jgi:hypothetical protein
MRLTIDILILIGSIGLFELSRKLRDWRDGRP